MFLVSLSSRKGFDCLCFRNNGCVRGPFIYVRRLRSLTVATPIISARRTQIIDDSSIRYVWCAVRAVRAATAISHATVRAATAIFLDLHKIAAENDGCGMMVLCLGCLFQTPNAKCDKRVIQLAVSVHCNQIKPTQKWMVEWLTC